MSELLANATYTGSTRSEGKVCNNRAFATRSKKDFPVPLLPSTIVGVLDIRALTEWYSRPDAFHREFIYLSEDRLAMLQDEVWEITQQYLDARRRGKWLLNTSNCFSYQRPCEYLAYCQSGFNPNVADNLYEIALPNEELSRVDSEAPPF